MSIEKPLHLHTSCFWDPDCKDLANEYLWPSFLAMQRETALTDEKVDEIISAIIANPRKGEFVVSDLIKGSWDISNYEDLTKPEHRRPQNLGREILSINIFDSRAEVDHIRIEAEEEVRQHRQTK